MKLALILVSFIAIGMAGHYLFKAQFATWGFENAERALAECIQEVTNLRQEQRTFDDVQRQIEYQEETDLWIRFGCDKVITEICYNFVAGFPLEEEFDGSFPINTPIDQYVPLPAGVTPFIVPEKPRERVCLDYIFNKCYKWL